MSDARQQIDSAFKLTLLGLKYLESRQRRRVHLAEVGLVDTVDEALREFEGLDIPEPYSVPDAEPMFTKHELEEGEDGFAPLDDDEPQGNPI